VGRVYSVPASLATVMIVEGWADPLMENANPTLPDIKLVTSPHDRRRRSLSDSQLRIELGIVADRRRPR
jgi:uncharacterized protein (DUF2342 family)